MKFKIAIMFVIMFLCGCADFNHYVEQENYKSKHRSMGMPTPPQIGTLKGQVFDVWGFPLTKSEHMFGNTSIEVWKYHSGDSQRVYGHLTGMYYYLNFRNGVLISYSKY